MKSKTNKLLTICVVSLLSFTCCFCLYTAWFWGNRQDWVEFGTSIVIVIVLAMWISTALIGWKIDERFDRLEELLRKKSDDDGGGCNSSSVDKK